MRWLRPFSRTTTDHPAAVRTSATVDPPGPLPTTTASVSRSATAHHLVVGPAPGLHVADEGDGRPPGRGPVAAVDGIAVGPLAGVLVQLPLELGVRRQASVLLLA